MKKKKVNYKKRLIGASVLSTFLFGGIVGYIFAMILFMKTLFHIPTEDFSSKLAFMGIILFYLLFKMTIFLIDVWGDSLKEIRESYEKIKEA